MNPRYGLQHNPLWLIALTTLLAITAGALVAYMAGGTALQGATTTVSSQPSTTATAQLAAIQPTPTATPRPTITPRPPTPTLTPTSTPTPTPLPTPAAWADPRDDLINYTTRQLMSDVPGAYDIQAASFTSERQLLQNFPPSLNGLQQPAGQFLSLWMTLYAPLPEKSTARANWLFALDVDANPGTGRPQGDGLINPDLGIEITFGIYADPENDAHYQPYVIIWNAQTQQSDSILLPAEVQFNAARDAFVLHIPLEALNERLRESAQIAPAWQQARGRAATLVTIAELAADFAPDLP